MSTSQHQRDDETTNERMARLAITKRKLRGSGGGHKLFAPDGTEIGRSHDVFYANAVLDGWEAALAWRSIR